MADEKNCGTCRYGLKPMSFPECISERCDDNYSNWTPDPENEREDFRRDHAAEVSDSPC